jgi:polysaccharide biosynthesis transport protein
MSLIQFLRILIARRWMILSTMLACMAVATVIAMLLPKRYPATARVMLDIVKPDPVTGRSIDANSGRSYIRTQIQLLSDMRVAGQVVDDLGLANDPATIARYAATGLTELDGGIRGWLGQQIIDNTSAQQVEGSNLLEIQYQGPTPETAKLFAAAIRDAYIEAALAFRTDAAGRTGDWYVEQAARAQQQLTAAEAQMSKFMQDNNIVLQAGVDSDLVRLQSLQGAVQSARGMQGSNDAAAAARLSNDPVADQLALQLATIEDELALAGARLGSSHPTYKAIQARRDTLSEALARARSNSQSSVAAVSGATRQSLAELEAELAAQERKVLARKPLMDQLVTMGRDVELKRAQFENAKQKAADLRLEANVSETPLVVLGEATVSRTPSYPKIPLVIGLSAFFGLALGVLAAIITEFLARRIRGEEDLAYATGVPVMVTVGSATPSPARLRLQRLLGRRGDDEPDGELQAI